MGRESEFHCGSVNHFSRLITHLKSTAWVVTVNLGSAQLRSTWKCKPQSICMFFKQHTSHKVQPTQIGLTVATPAVDTGSVSERLIGSLSFCLGVHVVSAPELLAQRQLCFCKLGVSFKRFHLVRNKALIYSSCTSFSQHNSHVFLCLSTGFLFFVLFSWQFLK